MPALHAPPAMIQLQKDGDRFPSSVWAQYKKPARPPTTAKEPSHSRRPTAEPEPDREHDHEEDQLEREDGLHLREASEVQGDGLEHERDDHEGEAKKPDSPPDRVGHEAELQSSSEQGAFSTPMRWNTLVSALANDAPSARIKTIELRFRPRYMYHAGI